MQTASFVDMTPQEIFLAALKARQAIWEEYIRNLERTSNELDQQIAQAIQILKSNPNINVRENMTLLHGELSQEAAEWAEDQYGHLVDEEFWDKVVGSSTRDFEMPTSIDSRRTTTSSVNYSSR